MAQDLLCSTGRGDGTRRERELDALDSEHALLHGGLQCFDVDVGVASGWSRRVAHDVGRAGGGRARVTDEWPERYRWGDTQSAHRIGRTVRRICPPDRLSSRSDSLEAGGRTTQASMVYMPRPAGRVLSRHLQ